MNHFLIIKSVNKNNFYHLLLSDTFEVEDAEKIEIYVFLKDWEIGQIFGGN